MPKTTNPNLQFLDTARAFYAEAFDHKKKRDLARSMEEWGELGEDEQSFTVAHLLYLNLQAQAANQRLLGQMRDLLDEVADALTSAIEASLPEDAPRGGRGDEAEADDDGVEGGDDDQVPDGYPVAAAPVVPPDDGPAVEGDAGGVS